MSAESRNGDGAAGETLWDARRQQTLDSVLERGWLAESDARAAFADYRDSDSGVGFASYLLSRGLLSTSQVAALSEGPDAGSAPGALSGEVRPGQVHSGCEIVEKLGQGGMGVVYLARRQSDGEEVVVKFLAASQVANRAGLIRFLREAAVGAKIDHPNVVKVFGVEAQGSNPHLVLELVRGTDLEERLEDEGALPAGDVVQIGLEVARGLAAAHSVGVIHRDIKPGNVRQSESGAIKILDFGLAKAVESDEGVSLAGQILGTPYYMAPEQWGEHQVDARTDVFSLGAMLYHLLTGELPFPGKRPMSVYRKAAAGQCERPSDVVDDVPPALELVILRMLAVDRRARYTRASDCVAAFEAIARGEAPGQGALRVPSLADPKRRRLFPLVPAQVHVIGRGEEADIQLNDASVSRAHARLSLGRTGYQLVDLDSSYGTSVNGMRIKDVLLKTGDVVSFGKQALRFDDAGISGQTTRKLEAMRGRLQVNTLPEPFMHHLVERGDRRVVITLIERLPLPTIEGRIAAGRDFLRATYGGKLAERAAGLLRAKLLKRRQETAKRLFQITFENLEEGTEAWLTWWDEHRGEYPPQLAPQRLRPEVRLRVRGEAGGQERVIQLSERYRTTIGRDADNDVCLEDRSLSRHHATILRLHQRLMIRDDGSRFGTRLGGKLVSSAFLGNGDQIQLGRVELRCEASDPVRQPPQTPQGNYLIGPTLFGILCDLEHPSVTKALWSFLPFCADLDWIDHQAAQLYEDAASIRACAEAVRGAYTRNRARATELLPRLVPALMGVDPGEKGKAWGKLLAKSDIGTQVLPVGWFQAT